MTNVLIGNSSTKDKTIEALEKFVSRNYMMLTRWRIVLNISVIFITRLKRWKLYVFDCLYIMGHSFNAC